MPASPGAWLVAAAMNLFRNARSTAARRRRLLSLSRARQAHGDPPAAPDERVASRSTAGRVRRTLDGMTERDRHLLLLRAEGYSYREMAEALGLHEASVGTLLARARAAFRERYAGASDAP